MSVKINKKGHIEITLDDAFINMADEQTTELPDYQKRGQVQDYIEILHSITYYIKYIDKDFEDNDYKCHMINLLENMLPNYEQAIKMFNTP